MAGTARFRRLRLTVLGFAIAIPLVALVACAHPHHAHHGPARGHAHRETPQRGVALVFDGELGVHVVAGYHAHYFHANRFYRYHDGHWMVSVHIDGPWKRVALKKLPPGLQRQTAKKHRGHGHGSPAKHDH